MKLKLLCLASGSAILCGAIAYKIYKVKRKFNSSPSPAKPSTNCVLIYGADDGELSRFGAVHFTMVYHVLAEAVRFVDMCTPTLNSISITNCLMSLQQRGDVRIKVVVYECKNYTQIELLKAYGVEVKVIATESLNHELVFTDACGDFKDALVIIGSIDYDMNDVVWERSITLITSEIKVVRKLKKEFDRIWQNYY